MIDRQNRQRSKKGTILLLLAKYIKRPPSLDEITSHLFRGSHMMGQVKEEDE